jgi:hypothetical protein
MPIIIGYSPQLSTFEFRIDVTITASTNGFCSALETSVRHGDVPMGMNSRKSPDVRTAMTAPGMGLFCGTTSWVKTFLSLSEYIGLDETSINLRPLFVRNGKNSAGAFTQGQAAAFSSGSIQTIWFLLTIMTLLSPLWLDTLDRTIKVLSDLVKISDTLFSSPRLIFPRSREPSTVLMDTRLSVIFAVFFALDCMTNLLFLNA